MTILFWIHPEIILNPSIFFSCSILGSTSFLEIGAESALNSMSILIKKGVNSKSIMI